MALVVRESKVDLMSKLKIEDIRKEVEQFQWQLIDEQYKNLKTEMRFKCPNGHDNYISLSKWRRSKKCIICENNPLNNTPVSPVKKNGYRIIAFDQASITSGFSIFDNDKLIHYGKWSSEGQHSTERIAQTKAWIACLIDSWKPDLVIFEDIQLQKLGTVETGFHEGVITYKKLAALQGVLKCYCYENNILYKIVTPSTWRAYNQIKGKNRTDRKKNAQLKIKSLYDIQVTQDEADAILIGRWAVNDYNKNKIIKFE